MDAERECGRLERGRPELALRHDADEGRGERAVRGQDCGVGGDPLRKLVLAVMVEQHLVDGGVECDGLELPEPRRRRGLDDDERADGIPLEPAGLGDEGEFVGMEPVEVADVPVQAPDGHDGVGVQQPRSQHRTEPVEVGVPVRRDDLFGAHRLILPRIGATSRASRARRRRRRRGRRCRKEPQTCAIASISTSAPLGSPEICTVERAGGRSPTCRA